FGGDYRSLEITTDAAGAPCKAACEADNNCRAWTYVRAGYIGGAARCYLKDHITRPRSKPCCISGVVR
ncbi:MAG: PAN domain-containing protein, partial [Pseudolabrys sp.]